MCLHMVIIQKNRLDAGVDRSAGEKSERRRVRTATGVQNKEWPRGVRETRRELPVGSGASIKNRNLPKYVT